MSAAQRASRDGDGLGAGAARTMEVEPGTTTETGSTGSQCLEALIVVVNEASDMRQRYTVTKELQLASLELNEACRSAHTVHLRVDEGIPTSLLLPVNVRGPGHEGRVSSRVSRLRARRVTWELPSLDLLSNPIDAWAQVEEICFGHGFNGSLECAAWPRRLRKMESSEVSRFNQPIGGVALPASLLQLSFQGNFNQPIEGVTWPTSLQELTLGGAFNQNIEGVLWPTSLQELTFGSCFSQPIEGVIWPSSLRQLDFRGLNHTIEGVLWPASLKKLMLGFPFNQPIERVQWPSSLIEFDSGLTFNRPIERVAWPPSLKKLTLGGFFNQPIRNVRWPTSLRQLTFGYSFNRSIDGVTWPSSLRQLTFRCSFNQPIGDVTWPPFLEELAFGNDFKQPLEESEWPSSLRQLRLRGGYSQSLRKLGTMMPALKQLTLQSGRGSTFFLHDRLRGIEWPSGLAHLTVDEDANLDALSIPPSVSVTHSDDLRW